MKYISILCLFSILFLACEEVPPVIRPVDQTVCNVAEESLVQDQKRQVLIEEFTGNRCVNCPAGSQAIEDLINIYGEQIVVASIHTGFWAFPYEQSKFDFQTEKGDELKNFLGTPRGYPAAIINRRLFDGEFNLHLARNLWPGFVEEELNKPPKAKIHINSFFDSSNRELIIEVSVFIMEDILENNVRLSVMITEDGVADYQLTPDGLKEDYVHNHILRDIVTNPEGNPVEADLQAGNAFCLSFRTILNENWKTENCRTLAFLSVNDDTIEVLQAQQVEIE